MSKNKYNRLKNDSRKCLVFKLKPVRVATTVHQMLCVLDVLKKVAGDHIIPTFFVLRKRLSDRKNIEILGNAIREYEQFLNDNCKTPGCFLNDDVESLPGDWCTGYCYQEKIGESLEAVYDCEGPLYGTCSVSYAIKKAGINRRLYWNKFHDYELFVPISEKEISNMLEKMAKEFTLNSKK